MQRLCSERGKISRPSRFGMGGRPNGQRSGELGRSSFVGYSLVVGKPHLFYRLPLSGKMKTPIPAVYFGRRPGRRISANGDVEGIVDSDSRISWVGNNGGFPTVVC